MSKPGQFGTFTITKNCEYCGVKFEAKSWTTKSCDSEFCNNKYTSYRSHQVRMRSIVRSNGSYSLKVFFNTCIICNDLFTSRTYNGNKCSCECKKEHNRRLAFISGREYRDNLRDPYILNRLTTKSPLTARDLKQHSKLIELKRVTLQIKRLT